MINIQMFDVFSTNKLNIINYLNLSKEVKENIIKMISKLIPENKWIKIWVKLIAHNKNKHRVVYTLSQTINFQVDINVVKILNKIIDDGVKSLTKYYDIEINSEHVLSINFYIHNEPLKLAHNYFFPIKTLKEYDAILDWELSEINTEHSLQLTKSERTPTSKTSTNQKIFDLLPFNAKYKTWPDKLGGYSYNINLNWAKFTDINTNKLTNSLKMVLSEMEMNSLINASINKLSLSFLNHDLLNYVDIVTQWGVIRLTDNMNSCIVIKKSTVKYKINLNSHCNDVETLKITKKHSVMSNNYISMDLECYKGQDDELIPYAGGFKSIFEERLYYINPYGDFLDSLLNDLIVKKYNDFVVYIHNSGNFDMFFLLKYLSKRGVINITKNKENKIISLILWTRVDATNIKLTFFDSYNILPNSLNQLAKDFNLNMSKTNFPYTFVSKETLFYSGIQPAKSFYNINDIVEIDSSKIWSTKDETLKYLKNDINILYSVLLEFNAIIWNNYNINMTKYPTIPSLTMKIFKSNFLEVNDFCTIKGNLYDILKQAYFGGLVDAYKPYGETLYQYDINSHYPAMMLKNMPTGTPINIKGDVCFKKNFGFFFVDVKSPKNLKVPILPVKTNSKTITPLGSWSGWYFGEELLNAENYGYKFKVHEAYIFNKFKPFDKFVNHFYSEKQTQKGTKKKIAKLFLNSLYGKLASSEILFKTKVVDNLDELNWINILNIVDLDNKFMVDELLLKPNHFNLINIAIAAAITAYGRIEINKYKNIKGNECIYSDTDSVILKYPLQAYLIGDNIGQMKLERIIKKGVFISAKTFSMQLNDNSFVSCLKGITQNATLDDKLFSGEYVFNSLLKLIKNTNTKLTLYQHKFIKNVDLQKLFYKKVPFIISINNDKRRLIIKNNLLKNTLPLIVKIKGGGDH